MEDDYIRHGFGPIETVYEPPRLVIARVTTRSHHHTHARTPLSSLIGVWKLPLDSGLQQVHQVAVESRQHDLGFRIAEAAVELENLQPFVGEDKSTV